MIEINNDIGVLILSAQDPVAETLYIRNNLGDQRMWFQKLLPVRPEKVRLVRILSDGLPPSVPEQVVVLPGSGLGSKYTLSELPNYPAFLKRMMDQGKKIIGICSGHNLFAEALGGKVIQNPKGLEMGTREIRLSDEARSSPVFEGIPEVFTASETHRNVVLRPANLPRGVAMAWNEMSGFQTIMYGDHITMQFHPEITAEFLRVIVRLRRETLFGSDTEAFQECLASIKDSPDAAQIIRNYFKCIVEPAAFRPRKKKKC